MNGSRLDLHQSVVREPMCGLMNAPCSHGFLQFVVVLAVNWDSDCSVSSSNSSSGSSFLCGMDFHLHRWRWILLTPPKPSVSLSSRHPRCVALRANGNLGTCSVQATRFRKHGNCVSKQTTAKEREYVALMSVRLPSVVLWHIICPKLCCALPEVSHLIRLWPSIINRHLAQLSQEFDSRPSAFSEVLTKWLLVMHWVEQSPSGDAVCYHPSSLPVSRYSRVSSKGFFSCASVSKSDSVLVLTISGDLRSVVEAIHECILFSSELSHVAR